ncbi:MAG: tRNA (cytidine(56)-2'-O)-methyltransferase, partial [Candidatus Micrarchaeota archaeon]|nr:tRNA (cytidine(56)-2'-O)-methyltransferase [Candidatus Micrarchaeota archaeon]
MIVILRLFHRIPRDERATSHVALAARAFGASGMVYCGMNDPGLEKSIERMDNEWGGNFFIEYTEDWKKTVREYRKKGFEIIHLTMYGERLDDEIKIGKDSLVVVGSEQVPIEMYRMADRNVSVTSQPHSEIAALAVFLDRAMKGKELSEEFDKANFQNAKRKIVPMKMGKK